MEDEQVNVITRCLKEIATQLRTANILKMTELNSSGAILDMEGGLEGVSDCDFMDAIDMFPILDEAVEDSKRRQAKRARAIREYEKTKRQEQLRRGVA